MSTKGQTFDDIGPLPAGWKTRMDPAKNRRCYYNRATKQTQWVRPKDPNAAAAEEPKLSSAVDEGVPPPASAGALVLAAGTKSASPRVPQESKAPDATAADALPAGWVKKVSSSGGETYYQNSLNGETTWKLPTQPATAGAAPEEAPAEDEPAALDEAPVADLEPQPVEPQSAEPESAPEPAAEPAVDEDLAADDEKETMLARDEETDELLRTYCSFVPESVRNCVSAVWTSCFWMVIRTLWDIVPWLVPFGLFMQSLSLQVESGAQLMVLLVFLATPMISMRYHGNSETMRNTLGDGWCIIFVGGGTMLTVTFVQVFLFILYDDIGSFLDLKLDGSNVTRVINQTSLSDPLNFGSAIFKGELLPAQFDEILEEQAFGKVFLAAPPFIIVLLVLILNLCTRCGDSKAAANDALSSELYSAGWFLWFYSMWLMLIHTKTDEDYFTSKTADAITSQVNAESIESVETVSYLVNVCAILFMSFSIAVQESTAPTKANDMSKALPTKSFSSGLGLEAMLWLIGMWFNGTIAVVTTFAWTYQFQDAAVWPYFVGLFVSLLYVCVYWYHVVWWYHVIAAKHNEVTQQLYVNKLADEAAAVWTENNDAEAKATADAAMEEAEAAADATANDDASVSTRADEEQGALGGNSPAAQPDSPRDADAEKAAWSERNLAAAAKHNAERQRQKEEAAAKAAIVKAAADARAKGAAEAKAEARKLSVVKVSTWRKFIDMFAPESDGFYTKQAFAELVEVMSQSYRAWLLLVIAMSGRFGAADGAGNYIVLGAFIGVVLLHALFSITVLAGCCSPSPYATVKVDLVFDQLYIVGGLVASIFLWTDGNGLPLCSAFPSDPFNVVTAFLPLMLSLWSLPTAITRTAIFTSDKRPSKRVLQQLFDAIDSNSNNSLDSAEIQIMCEGMGAKLTPAEVKLAMSQLNPSGDEKITFDQFSLWTMEHGNAKEHKKLAKAMTHFRASGLQIHAKPPTPQGIGKYGYITLAVIACLWAVAVAIIGFMLDGEVNRLPFHSSMDQGMVYTTNATFSSTFLDYEAVGIKPDTTASFIVLDKYTALRFEDVDVPAGAVVTSATISFAPYVAGDEHNPSQAAYCVDTNNLGDAANGVGISAIDVIADTVTVSATDASSVVVGQKLRLTDAAGQSCGATPSGDSALVVTSVAGGVITFSAELRGVQMTPAELAKCVLKRAVCTSPMQIDQGNLRIKARTTAVSEAADPSPMGGDTASVTAPFVGAQNFAISGLEGIVTQVIGAAGWTAGNPMQFHLELLPTLSAVDGAEFQSESASCVAAGESSCYFPKQFLAASCDSPQLTVVYTLSGEVEEVTAVVWPKATLSLFKDLF